MIAVVTMMFSGRILCDAYPFLVPHLKTKGVTASSVVRRVLKAGKDTFSSWLALGGGCMARVVKEAQRARAVPPI